MVQARLTMVSLLTAREGTVPVLPPTGPAVPTAPPSTSPAGPPTLGAEQALGCVRAALDEGSWGAACTALVTTLCHELGASRVSLAWVGGRALHVVALSGGAPLAAGPLLPELQQAMLEASHQHCSLVWPPLPPAAALPGAPASASPALHITLAHQALCKTLGLRGLVSVPLARDGQVLGVLLCERAGPSQSPETRTSKAPMAASKGAFTPSELQWLTALAEVATPALSLRHELDRPWLARRQADWAHLRHRLADPTQGGLRWGLGAAALALLGLGLLPLPHQVTATARLEGAVQRVMSAPQDGFLREVLVRPGDTVKTGQVLAQLADDDLQAARRAHLADIAQRENEFADAFARGERAQAMTAQNKLAAIQAQLALVEQQLARLKVVAPFDGVVIQGDLRQQLGAPLKRGDSLLTLAPGLDWRVVLEVPEADIARLAPGQTAGLRLAALPDLAIGLQLARVTPVAKLTPEGLRYEIEARPQGAAAQAPGLRPGLQGVARIEMPAEPLLQRAWRRSSQWLRLFAWTWF
jgi:hypothetical protein